MPFHVGNEHAARITAREFTQLRSDIQRNQIMLLTRVRNGIDFTIDIFMANLAGQFIQMAAYVAPNIT